MEVRTVRERVARVGGHLVDLQDRICASLAAADGTASFREDVFSRGRGGAARPRVLEDGDLLEKAAVHFSHSVGERLPEAATARRPQLSGSSFEAVSLSLIVHPRSPRVPTTHLNLRLFEVVPRGDGPGTWWIGGGFDLTPYYGFDEDGVDWHRSAARACAVLGPEAYPRFKRQCDEYFYLPHRGETRGLGGLFFDDLDAPDFPTCARFLEAVGEEFLPAYLRIVDRRRDLPWGEPERDFQLYRRGRYVEFNLLYDRGTLFGLQAGGRVESVLASMPPAVRFRYDWSPAPGSAEAELYSRFLVPRDWLAEAGGPPGSGG